MMFGKGMAVFNGFGQSNFMWSLRTNPHIYKIFQEVHQTEDLVVSLDGFSVYLSDKQKSKSWLHIDQNPTNELFSIQGAYNFMPVGEKDAGFVVLGFPSHDFYQEPSTEKEIKDFCNLTYDVQFPMFTKTTVRGKNAHPFFKLLTKETNSSPKWNFHKYLIGKDGTIVDSFSTVTGPGSNKIIKKIDELLGSS